MTQILTNWPELSAAYNSRAYAAHLCGERKVALRDARLAVRYERRNGPAWLTKAAIELAGGEEEYALASARKALEAGVTMEMIRAEADLAPLLATLASPGRER